MTTRTTSPASSDPASWWRVLCEVADTRIIVTGDLHTRPSLRAAQLQEWVDAGVTDIIDCRIERSDEHVVSRLQPQMHYHWVGVDDHGGEQPDDWFEAGVSTALAALNNPSSKVLVHCHMGVNRGPSMAFAIMLALGWSPADALDAIRTARPIAGIIYADQALDWWHRFSGATTDRWAAEWQELTDWMSENPVDVDWVVSRIWRAEVA